MTTAGPPEPATAAATEAAGTEATAPAGTSPLVVAARPDEPLPAETAGSAAPAAVQPEALEAGIAQILGEAECAKVDRVAEAGGGVRYAGVVSSEADRLRLVEAARAAGEAAPVALDFAVVGRPFCTALVALPTAAEGRDVMRLNDEDGIFLDGELLQVDVGPVPESGHLYVTFVDHTGEVLQMLPNPVEEDTTVEAGDSRQLGVEEGVLQVLRQLGVAVGNWRIEGPYGRGMILAYVTPEPLTIFPRPPDEPAGSFFTALTEALEEDPASWVRYRWIDTRPRS